MSDTISPKHMEYIESIEREFDSFYRGNIESLWSHMTTHDKQIAIMGWLEGMEEGLILFANVSYPTTSKIMGAVAGYIENNYGISL